MPRTLDDIIHAHKHICWYPSANADFRGLLYLSERYFEWKKIPRQEGQYLPDLFIMTDISPSETTSFVNMGRMNAEEGQTDIRLLGEGRWRGVKNLYSGYRWNSWNTKVWKVTDISVARMEKLAAPEISYEPGFYRHSGEERPARYGEAFYIRAHVVSGQREDSPAIKWYEYDRDIVYVLADNLCFARDCLLKNHISTEYVIQIRYGEGFGGSAVPGSWLGLMLDNLKCRYFMANPRYAGAADVAALPFAVKSFFDGYQMKAVSYEKIASLRDHRFCLPRREDDFDDINLYRVLA